MLNCTYIILSDDGMQGKSTINVVVINAMFYLLNDMVNGIITNNAKSKVDKWQEVQPADKTTERALFCITVLWELDAFFLIKIRMGARECWMNIWNSGWEGALSESERKTWSKRETEEVGSNRGRRTKWSHTGFILKILPQEKRKKAQKKSLNMITTGLCEKIETYVYQTTFFNDIVIRSGF